MDAKEFKGVIEDIIDAKLDNKGITKYISAIVSSINSDNTINVYLPPDDTSIITGLLNKTGEMLSANDSVELCTKNGKIKNAWVALKHSTNFIATAGGDSIPIGTMMPYGNETPPSNWLVCDGREVSRTDYAELFAVIGTSYGEGDGDTTFNLPNKRGKVSVGFYSDGPAWCDEIGWTGGEQNHTLTVDEMPSHNHQYEDISGKAVLNGQFGRDGGYSNDAYMGVSNSIQGYSNANFQMTKVGGGQAHNNLQPYEVDQWIIKAFKDTSIPSSSQVQNVRTVSSTDVYSCTYVNEHTASGDTLPIGAIVDFNGSAIPDGYEEYSGEVTLYENSSGTTSDITLSDDSFTNYNKLRISATSGTEVFPDQDFVINKSNATLSFNSSFAVNGGAYISCEQLIVNNNILTRSYYYRAVVVSGATPYAGSQATNVMITKIIGYK